MNRPQREPGLFPHAFRRFALAGIAFLVVYGGCNRLTALRGEVPTLMFDWERHIPFVREFVIPYWSLDLFFCASFFLCRNRIELDLLTKRLLGVLLFSAAWFLIFPLKMGLPRPEPEGWTAPLFHLLYANDHPFNLAPSLHISQRSILWVLYGAILTGWLRTVVKIWFILIGLSTLLVWQHHLVDVGTGFLAGWFIAAVIPDPRQMGTRNPSGRLALRYGVGTALCAALSFAWIGFAWPAIACGIMSVAYGTGLSRLLGKENGTLSPSAEWCLLPVILGRGWVQRRWLNRRPGWREIGPGVMFGRRVSAAEAEVLAEGGDLAVIDLTAETNAPAAFRERSIYHNIPLLDLVPLQAEHVEAVVDLIGRERRAGRRVFVHCQLGLQRSAGVVAHWLAAEEGIALEAARDRVRAVEPGAVI